MKPVCVAFIILSFVAIIVFAVMAGFREYNYSVRIGQYIKTADDASMPALKLECLKKYKEAVIEKISRGSARYIFTQERLTKKVQLASLDSLIKRLEDINLMQPDSLSYQQGMAQITGQEFDHTLSEIDGVFHDCYMRDCFFVRYATVPMIFISLGFVVLFIILLFIATDNDW